MSVVPACFRGVPLHAEKYVEKSTCRAKTSSPTRMGRPCAKSDRKKGWAEQRENGAIFVCLSVVTCKRHDYVYVYGVYVAAAAADSCCYCFC